MKGRRRREVPLVWNFPYLLFSLHTPALHFFPVFFPLLISLVSESSEMVTILFLPNIINQKIKVEPNLDVTKTPAVPHISVLSSQILFMVSVQKIFNFFRLNGLVL